MVFRTKAGLSRVAAQRRNDEAPDVWAGGIEVAQLKTTGLAQSPSTSLFALYQPLQGFLACLEGGEIALREVLDVFVEHMRDRFGANPG